MSASHAVKVHLPTPGLNGTGNICPKFAQSGIVFGSGAAASVRDEAKRLTANSVGEGDAGYITPICQDDSHPEKGAKATTNSLGVWCPSYEYAQIILYSVTLHAPCGCSSFSLNRGFSQQDTAVALIELLIFKNAS